VEIGEDLRHSLLGGGREGVEIGEDLPIRFRELNALSKISHVGMPLGILLWTEAT